MQTVVTNPGVTHVLHDEPYYYRPEHGSRSATPASEEGILTYILCCGWLCPDKEEEDSSIHDKGMLWGSVRRRQSTSSRNGDSGGGNIVVGHDFHRVGGISKEMYDKIQEVDKQTSTLSTSVQGLSARVIDRFEFQQQQPDGSAEWYVCQTVELIKRPGQTLGLYIREGNGLDRADGVFVSRLAAGSEIEKTNVLKVGDEVLSVNTVEVSHIPVDDVVVIMSIPRRLVLKTKCPKHAKAVSARPPDKSRPVVVLKQSQLPRETSRESGLDEEIESHTAQTSLGSKTKRHASAEPVVSERTPLLLQKAKTSPQLCRRALDQAHAVTAAPLGSDEGTLRPPQENGFDAAVCAAVQQAQRDCMLLPFGDDAAPRPQQQTREYRRNVAFHSPRVLDSQGRPLAHSAIQDNDWAYPSASNVAFRTSGAPLNPANHMSHYVPSGSQLPYAVKRTESLDSAAYPASTYRQSAVASAAVAPLSPRSVISDPEILIQPRSTPSAYPSPLLGYRQTAAPGTFRRSMYEEGSTYTATDVGQYTAAAATPGGYGAGLKPALRHETWRNGHTTQETPAWKANSLPRRRLGRQVKWKNDVGRPILSGYATDSYMSDSDGAASAPETAMSPIGYPQRNRHYNVGRPQTGIRTIDDIFTSEEYRAWMQQPNYAYQQAQERKPRDMSRTRPFVPMASNWKHVSAEGINHNNDGLSQSLQTSLSTQRPPRWSIAPEGYAAQTHDIAHRGPYKARSSSVPPQRVLDAFQQQHQQQQPATVTFGQSMQRLAQSSALQSEFPAYSLHHTDDLSRMKHRPLSGMLVLHIVEGRGLSIPEKRGEPLNEMYCVVEVDTEHRARTSVSTWEQKYVWNEVFEIEIADAKLADFFIYSWDPQLRHKLRYRGSLQLLEEFFEATADRKFALNLEPRGQLIIKLTYRNLRQTFQRSIAVRLAAYFGVDIAVLVEREQTGLEVPVALKRLIEEVERRSVTVAGLYLMCGSASKKQELRNNLEKSPILTDLMPESVPDINVLTGLIKDFLRELPEPLLTSAVYQMLLEAWAVCIPNDREGNVRLMLGVVDCLPRVNKCTVMVLMDHFKFVTNHSADNNMTPVKLCSLFGALCFCTSKPNAEDKEGNGRAVDFLDISLATRLLLLLLDMWPSRNSSSESSGSDNSTLNQTNNGDLSLVDLWMQSEHRIRESSC